MGGAGYGYLSSGKWGKIKYPWIGAVTKKKRALPPVWKEGFDIENAPDWWTGKVYTKPDANSMYAMIVNALIPYMSPEDQRTAATSLSRTFPKGFGEYDPETMQYPIPPGEIGGETKEWFTSSRRAQEALNTLTTLSTTLKKNETQMGAGYSFLRDLLTVMKDFGGQDMSNQQTREQFVQQMGALEPMLQEAKSSDLKQYASLAQSLTQPFFSAGNVVPIIRTKDGRYIFGETNPQLY